MNEHTTTSNQISYFCFDDLQSSGKKFPKTVIKNTKLAKQVVHTIENEIKPKQFDMWDVITPTSKHRLPYCGTVACLAGWTIHLHYLNQEKTYKKQHILVRATALLMGLPEYELLNYCSLDYPSEVMYLYSLFSVNLPPQQHKDTKALNKVSLKLFKEFFGI